MARRYGPRRIYSIRSQNEKPGQLEAPASCTPQAREDRQLVGSSRRRLVGILLRLRGPLQGDRRRRLALLQMRETS